MNRRDALKKLGVGSAIVISAPAVLPVTRVAHAASGGVGNTGLIDPPLDGDPMPYFHVEGSGSAKKRQVGIVLDNSAVTCADGSLPDFSVQWMVSSVTFDSGGPTPRLLRVMTGSNEVATTPLVENQGSGGWGPLAYTESFTVEKRRKGNKSDVFRSGDVYTLVARCRWHCPGAPEDLVADYTFTGQSTGAPSVANVLWTDSAPA